MKKLHIAFSTVALIFLLMTMCVYASEIERIPGADIIPEQETEEAISFFSARTAPQMDFSRLDGKLTVEVNGNFSEESVLCIGEYNSEDKLINAYVINDVQPENTVNINGEYERAFLWCASDMMPLCSSITTKCDYEIIEGVEGEWEVSSDGHTLYNYTGTAKEVVIPNSYRGKRIYAVQNVPAIQSNSYSSNEFYKYNIFNARTDITAVSISEGIRMIGSVAFGGCSSLVQKLEFPESLRIIGMYAFYNCTGLTGDLDLSRISTLNKGAFFNCSSINGKLTLPPIEVLKIDTFYNCKALSGELVIPEGVRVIEEYVFANNSGPSRLTALKLPSTIREIHCYAFQFQTAFSNKLILPEGLEFIGDGVFNHCVSFANTTLDIPSTLKTIGGDYGVENNTGYGSHVFYDSFKKVTEFNADSDYFKSYDGVLYSSDMTRLVAYPLAKTDTSLIIPEGVVQIDEMVLAYTKLTDVTLPDSYIMLENIPSNVLNYQLANNLAVAFYHYNSIKNVWVKETNPNYISIDGVVYSKDMKDLWYVPSKNTTGKIIVADGVENIRKGAFYIENTALTCESYNGVHIPSSVKNINSCSLSSINRRPLADITVDENNLYYMVNNGKLVKKR